MRAREIVWEREEIIPFPFPFPFSKKRERARATRETVGAVKYSVNAPKITHFPTIKECKRHNLRQQFSSTLTLRARAREREESKRFYSPTFLLITFLRSFLRSEKILPRDDGGLKKIQSRSHKNRRLAVQSRCALRSRVESRERKVRVPPYVGNPFPLTFVPANENRQSLVDRLYRATWERSRGERRGAAEALSPARSPIRRIMLGDVTSLCRTYVSRRTESRRWSE